MKFGFDFISFSEKEFDSLRSQIIKNQKLDYFLTQSFFSVKINSAYLSF